MPSNRFLLAAIAAVALFLIAFAALADAAVAQVAAAPAIDLTGVAVTGLSSVFSILGVLALAWIRKHVADQTAAATLEKAVANSLGAMQQAATMTIASARPAITLPAGAPPQLYVGVQYVLDHAGDEAARLGITNDRIASKVLAQVGLANIATNVAIAGSDTPPMPKPLDPVPAALPPQADDPGAVRPLRVS